ncbi:cytidylyltransferase domain-containing protein [Candidatus Margulisiibacteriota bacterium]
MLHRLPDLEITGEIVMKKNIAIIPARAGSKRINNKNIIDLCGKPLIAWTIEAALESDLFDDVLVSTDSEEIAEIAITHGAIAPFLRNKSTSDDYTPVSEATVEALIRMEEYKTCKYKNVIQLMPNCPCRTAVDIGNAYENFSSSGNNFQISVFEYGWMNPWWAMGIETENRRPRPLFPDALKQRSQDLEKLYCPTGSVWVAKADALKAEKTFYGKDYSIFPLSWQSAVDIDNQEDLNMAEAVFYIRELIK